MPAYKQPARDKIATLIDQLRRSLLYQTPQPVFVDPKDEQPNHFLVKLTPRAYATIMDVAGKAGGWSLSEADKKVIEQRSDERARVAYNDGKDFNFSGLSIGELYSMHEETSATPELAAFNKAIAAEIDDRRKDALGAHGAKT